MSKSLILSNSVTARLPSFFEPRLVVLSQSQLSLDLLDSNLSQFKDVLILDLLLQLSTSHLNKPVHGEKSGSHTVN